MCAPCVAEYIAIAGKPTPTLDARRTQNLCSLEIRVGASLLAMNDYTVSRWLLGHLDVIQHPVHCQFRQHDDLLNRHHRVPMWPFQITREVAGHDAGRGE